MRITKNQRALLRKLKCERLSKNESNLRLVSTFAAPKNQGLTDLIQGEAYEQDVNGTLAFYLVKDEHDRILFYFSLKCGQMFDSLKLSKNDALLKLVALKLSEAIHDENLSDVERQEFAKELNRLVERKDIGRDELNNPFSGKHNAGMETTETIKRVNNTFAGVELAHFCKNSNLPTPCIYDQLPQKLGVIVFWKFIVPIVLKLKKLVACQYLYLFAADLEPDQHLVSYYSHRLDFKHSGDYKSAIPDYDQGCVHMWQDTADLCQRRKDFFNHFNVPV